MNTLPQIIPFPKKARNRARWSKSQHTNLQRDRRGLFRVNAFVCGQKVRKVLKTKSVTTAIIQRDALLAEARRKAGARADGLMTFAAMFANYKAAIQGDSDLRERSKKYRIETVGAIERTWPELSALALESVKPAQFATWAGKLRLKYSATRYNATLETMRAILKPAVQSGYFAKNPIDECIDNDTIIRAKVVVKDRSVPSPEQLNALFAALKPNKGPRYTAGTRTSNAYYLARFLRHFSLRIGTALALTPDMVKRAEEQFHIPSELVKWGGKGKIYRVPIFPEMFKVLDELDKKFGKDRKLVLPFKVSDYALKSACKEVGIEPALCFHDFRHIFSSYALMKTKDAPLVASWRGDKDGGGTLLKIYSHILDDHSKKMARRMR